MSLIASLWRILTPAERRGAGVLSVLMLVGMLLEALGTGLIVPALDVMTSPDLSVTSPALVRWIPAVTRGTRPQLVITGMALLVVAYGVKAAFLAVLAFRQSRFAYGTQASLSERLFRGYLHQPWTFHLQRNSAQLLRNATTEVSNFTAVVQGAMTTAAEGSVVVGLAVLILAVEPLAALLVIANVALASWIFYRVTRARLLRWGETRLRHEGLRIQHLQQGLGGVKDVKVLGREDAFVAQYSEHNLATARATERQFTLQQLPRLWLEFLAIVGLALLVSVMLAQGRPIERLLPTLGLFGAAAFRLMPSAVRIMVAVQTMRFCRPVIHTLADEIALIDVPRSAEAAAAPLRFAAEIALAGVTFTYPGAAAPALRDVTLAIPRGASIGFVGGSGAGKSTLVDVILGLLTPQAGTIRADGVDIQTNLRGWQDQIGYVPQSIYLTDDSLRRNVAFGIPEAAIDEAAVRRAIAAAQLEGFVASLPHGLDTTVGERGVQLSGGQRQRIGIARALYHDPALLVLDEATSALDGATEHGVMEAVRALHGTKTVLIVAHRLSTIAHCDRLYRMAEGRIVEQGVPAALTGAPGA
jgi:ABC-type multidrug transport system fused ATPase/permease subunit